MWGGRFVNFFSLFSHKKEKHTGSYLKTKLKFLLIVNFFLSTKIHSDSRTRLECSSYNKEQEVKSWEVSTCSRCSMGQVTDTS